MTPTPQLRPQFLEQAKREFAFVTTLGFFIEKEYEGTYASFKDGFHIDYRSPNVLFRIEYYDMEFFPTFTHQGICASYYFIDTFIFANLSGFAGAMFPTDKLEPVITRISTDINEHYRDILSGETEIWHKIAALATAPREKRKIP